MLCRAYCDINSLTVLSSLKRLEVLWLPAIGWAGSKPFTDSAQKQLASVLASLQTALPDCSILKEVANGAGPDQAATDEAGSACSEADSSWESDTVSATSFETGADSCGADSGGEAWDSDAATESVCSSSEEESAEDEEILPTTPLINLLQQMMVDEDA